MYGGSSGGYLYLLPKVEGSFSSSSSGFGLNSGIFVKLGSWFAAGEGSECSERSERSGVICRSSSPLTFCHKEVTLLFIVFESSDLIWAVGKSEQDLSILACRSDSCARSRSSSSCSCWASYLSCICFFFFCSFFFYSFLF